MVVLENIERRFSVGGQTVYALRGVRLRIDFGEYLSVMGPSGSGKSTLLNILSLLDRPTAGTYHLNGRDVTQLSDDELARQRRENFGFVFQFFHLVPRLTAAENIELPMVLAGVPRRERKARVAAALRAFALESRAAHRPNELSGGQRQRVAIARATILRPGCLLADEPTGNLDRASAAEVIELLEGLHAEGMTLVVVTHDPELGARAPRRVRLFDGALAGDERVRAAA